MMGKEVNKMQWSRFNLMFTSEGKTLLLYNFASNSFLQLEEDALEIINNIKKHPHIDLSSHPNLYLQLRLGGFLVEDKADEDFVRILKMNRLASNYASNQLSLTIAISKVCNFDCDYCYEKNRTPPVMSEETADALVGFIKKHKHLEKINVTWYGGEPLLEFDKLSRLSRKMQALKLMYDAQLITNGYLLTPEVISYLEELNISHLQITIDGIKETHNKRRYLKGGGGTYERIMDNISHLMDSDWNGKLHLRVNVDKRNSHEFAKVYECIKKLYPEEFDKKITVYPGFVNDGAKIKNSDYFDSCDKGQFLVNLSSSYKTNPLKTFPHRALDGCTMTRKNAYVVGPKGELYKCWRNLGEENEVIGVVNSFTNWNMSLVAEGMIGGSYLEDNACERCLLFSICDGGCPKMRILNKRDNGNRDMCSYFKKHIEQLLEVHYRQKNC